MMEPEIIQRFLESVGQKADVDLYLKLFRAQRKESFAILAAGAQIVRARWIRCTSTCASSRAWASAVGLLGCSGQGCRPAQRVQDWLVEDAVPARIVPLARAGPETIAGAPAIGAGEIRS